MMEKSSQDLALEILGNLRKRKGGSTQQMLSIKDIEALKSIANNFGEEMAKSYNDGRLSVVNELGMGMFRLGVLMSQSDVIEHFLEDKVNSCDYLRNVEEGAELIGITLEQLHPSLQNIVALINEFNKLNK